MRIIVCQQFSVLFLSGIFQRESNQFGLEGTSAMVHDDLIMMKQDSYLSAVDKTWLQTKY